MMAKQVFLDLVRYAAEQQADLELDRNQTTDLDDLVTWQIEVIGHVGGVPFHYGEKLFLPAWQPPRVLATGHRLVPDEIGDVGEIDGTSAFLELRQ